MVSMRVTAIFLCLAFYTCISLSKREANPYPIWFLEPPDQHWVGIATAYSKPDVSRELAETDALAIYYLTHGGDITTNTIYTEGRLADSSGFNLDSLSKKIRFKRIHEAFVGTIYLALFYVQIDNSLDITASIDRLASKNRVYAIGKQSVHTDKLYESWGSAEFEAYKELSRIKFSNVSSIQKMGVSRLELLIHLRSQTEFIDARIERRWQEGEMLYVEVSDVAPLE